MQPLRSVGSHPKIGNAQHIDIDDNIFIRGLKSALANSRDRIPNDGQTFLTPAQRTAGRAYVRSYLGGLEHQLKGHDYGGWLKSGGSAMPKLVEEPMKAHRARLITLLKSQSVNFTEVDAFFLITGDVPRGFISITSIVNMTAMGLSAVLEPVALPIHVLNDTSICISDITYDGVRTIVSKAQSGNTKKLDDTDMISRPLVAPPVSTTVHIGSCCTRIRLRIANLKIVKALQWCWGRVPSQHKEVIKEELKDLKQAAKKEGKAALKDLYDEGKATIHEVKEGISMARHQPFRFIFRYTCKLLIGGAVFIVAKRNFYD
jgi:hypothetical protein